MKIIAIANQKGGCGKTTTAINLAACLARKTNRVLLLDLDPQGHASLGLKVYREDARDLYHVLSGQASLDEIIIPDVCERLDLVPATLALTGVEQLPLEPADRDQLLNGPLASVRDCYDYAVVDCPSSFGLLSLNALAASDLVLIPIEISTFGIAGIKRMYETVALLRERQQHEITIRVLPTLVDSRTRLCRSLLREVWEHFADDVFSGVVPFTVRLREAVHKGIPIVAYDPASSAAKQYDRLADEVMVILRGDHVDVGAAGRLSAISHAMDETGLQHRENDRRREVVLRFAGFAGEQVQLAGDFNNWEPDQDVITRTAAGMVEKVLVLKPGVYQYRLIVDGRWQDDASNPDRSPNLVGGCNSLLRVEEPAETVSE